MTGIQGVQRTAIVIAAFRAKEGDSPEPRHHDNVAKIVRCKATWVLPHSRYCWRIHLTLNKVPRTARRASRDNFSG
jgi:hypothetical protein